MAAVAFLLLCWQASPARGQVAGMARLGTFPVALDEGVGGRVMSPASSPIVVAPAAQEDSSNVKEHMVIGAAIGAAAAVVLTTFEYSKCIGQSAQSEHGVCGIILMVGVPAAGVGALFGGILGWVSAGHPRPTREYSSP